MPVPTAITDLSATASSNSPSGSDAVFPDLDNYLRAHASLIRQGDTKASDVASASTTDIGAAAGRIVDVTGTTTITSLGTVAAGVWRIVRFTGALTLTHNATSLILPGGENITTTAGDSMIAVSLGSGNWVIVNYQRGGTWGASRFSTSVSAASTTSGYATTFTASENVGSDFNASTGTYTAPQTGLYTFSFVAKGSRLVVTDSIMVSVGIRIDGVGSGGITLLGAPIDSTNAAASQAFGCYSRAFYLTAGQAVRIYGDKLAGYDWRVEEFSGAYIGRGAP